jgi:hypothetical protein
LLHQLLHEPKLLQVILAVGGDEVAVVHEDAEFFTIDHAAEFVVGP